jgi:hypothetical protein
MNWELYHNAIAGRRLACGWRLAAGCGVYAGTESKEGNNITFLILSSVYNNIVIMG